MTAGKFAWTQRMHERHSLNYLRVYADPTGEPHFADVDIDLPLTTFASPGTPLQLSSVCPATGYGFLHVPAGWHHMQRPTPRRELNGYLPGEVESEMSDGEVRRPGTGSFTLVEDTTSRGHASRVVRPDGVLSAVVHLPD